MFDNFLQFAASSIAFITYQLLTILSFPFLPNQRIYWLYMLTSLILAFYVYQTSRKSIEIDEISLRGFINYLFPKYIWRHPSAWLDVRYFFFHQIFRLVVYGAFLTAVLNFAFQFTTGSSNPVNPVSPEPGISNIIISLIFMFALIGFVDFVSYGIHYLQHKIPLLWEFHKVHHSLEVMHPLSNYREHPIDNIAYALGTGAAYGLFMALTVTVFGYVPSLPQLLGVPLLVIAFNILGYNLRHSHVWLRWPGRWSMLFASSAHHHIHHSCHPDHIDRNFAFVFPFWDVLFNTYCLPETNKDVHFGLSRDYINEYDSCLGIYFIPFKKVFVSIIRRMK